MTSRKTTSTFALTALTGIYEVLSLTHIRPTRGGAELDISVSSC
jgi:hypothetical protein